MKTAMEMALARIEMLYIEKDNIHWEMFKNDCMEKEKSQIIDAVDYGCSDWGSSKDAEKYYKQTYNK